MTDIDRIASLADRVEALTRPCRKTDALIWRAFVPDAKYWGDSAAMAFTASLDVAMTLVPQGYDWSIGLGPDGGPRACVTGFGDDHGHFPDYASHAATVALALTAAALRAYVAKLKDATDGK